MKNPERVAALIAQLKAECSTPFEYHRVAVLEKDFFNPPKVEQIDDTHQKFDGLIFSKRKCGHYEKGIGIHQVVWNYFIGKEITEEFVIHHVDENPANNDISNLQMLTRRQHARLHDRKPYWCQCRVCSKPFQTKGGELYCSPECKSIAQTIWKECKLCGKKFPVMLKHSRERVYCSKECQLRARTLRRMEILSRNKEQCRCCGKTFPSSERIKGGFCSKKCERIYHFQVNSEKRICAYCGKEFDAYKYRNAKYCSRSCAARMRNNTPKPQKD